MPELRHTHAAAANGGTGSNLQTLSRPPVGGGGRGGRGARQAHTLICDGARDDLPASGYPLKQIATDSPGLALDGQSELSLCRSVCSADNTLRPIEAIGLL